MAVKTKAHLGAATASPVAPHRETCDPAARAWARAGQKATAVLLQEAQGPSIQRILTDMQATVGNQAVQRMVTGRRHAGTAQRIEARAGRGRPLEAAVQRKVGNALGTDLSTVNVHDDDEADQLATSLGAEAFTSGHDIYFAKGAYDPSSEKGLKTVAHEATHVVQQSRGPVDGAPIGGGINVSDPRDGFEREAEATAEKVSAGGGGGKALDGKAAGQPAGGTGAGAAVQRKCGCRGSCGPCGGGGEKEPEETATGPVQRLASPSSSLSIQRAPLPLEQMGDLQVMFNPSASITFTPPGSPTSTTVPKNDATDKFTFSDVPRGSSGQMNLDVAMQWFGKPAPGPIQKNCDICEILHQAFIVNILGITKVDLLPASLLAKCRELVTIDPNSVLDVLLEIQEAALDPCGKLLQVLNVPAILRLPLSTLGCGVALAIPFVAQGVNAVQKAIAFAVSQVRQAMKNLPPECKNGGKTDPALPKTGELRGGGRSVLRANFQVGADKKLVFTGLPPQASRFGKSAELTIPVDFVRDGTPTGGSIAQQPLIKTVGEANAAAISKAFTAELVNAKAPPDASFLCKGSFGPFKIASDQFVKDDQKIQELRTYYFGMHPKIRQHLEEGKGQLLITGRASITGSQAKNLGFAEKRAARVKKILQGFAGVNASFNVFHLGELGAQTPGEVDGERRADVEAKGTVLEGGALQSPCVGHEAEPTPTGSTQPVTEGEDVTGVPAGTSDSSVPAQTTDQTSGGAGQPVLEPASFEQEPIDKSLFERIDQQQTDLIEQVQETGPANGTAGGNGSSDFFESAFA